MNEDIVRLIAEFIDPSPAVYFNLAAVCRTFYWVFLSDRVWQFLNPYGLDKGIVKHFKAICSVDDRKRIKNNWEERNTQDLPAPDNLYLQLSMVVFTYTYKHMKLFKPMQREDLMWCAVNIDGKSIRFAGRVLCRQRRFALAAVTPGREPMKYVQGRSSLEYLEDFRDDREIVSSAIQNEVSTLQWASLRLRSDRGIVLTAVKMHRLALQYASEELRADREIVNAAIQNDALALQYASEELRGDREIVLRAVRKHPLALQYASEQLRGDREMLLVSTAESCKS